MNIDNLIKLRKSLGLTQKDVATLIDVKRNTYSEYEHNKAIMPLDKLNILANTYDVSLDYLMGLTNKNNASFNHIDLNYYKIGSMLKELRMKNKYTQEELADKLKTNHARISDYENGKRINVKVIISYSKLFNKSVDFLCLKKI